MPGDNMKNDTPILPIEALPAGEPWKFRAHLFHFFINAGAFFPFLDSLDSSEKRYSVLSFSFFTSAPPSSGEGIGGIYYALMERLK
jgi:hypothetical protein